MPEEGFILIHHSRIVTVRVSFRTYNALSSFFTQTLDYNTIFLIIRVIYPGNVGERENCFSRKEIEAIKSSILKNNSRH